MLRPVDVAPVVVVLCVALVDMAAVASPQKFADQVIEHKRTYRAIAPLAQFDASIMKHSSAEVWSQMSRLLSTRGMNPQVRHHVVRVQAKLHRSRGELADSEKLLRNDGVVVSGWWMMGPQGAPSVDMGQSPDVSQSVQGTNKSFKWRNVSQAWPNGSLPLGRLVSPADDDKAVVALNHLWADRTKRVLVRASSEGATRVSVNGIPSSDGAAVLVAGWNTIVVHCTKVSETPWALRVRVSHPNGAPFRAASRVFKPGLMSIVKGKPATHRVVAPLINRWRQTREPKLEHLRARALIWLGDSFDFSQFSDAVSDSKNSEILLEAARLATRSDVALHHLHRLLSLHPGHIEARLLLAQRNHQRGQMLSALSIVRSILKLQPTHGDALWFESEILGDLQFYGEAQALLLALYKRFPDVPRVLRSLGAIYQSRQQPEKAIETFHRLSKANNMNGDAIYWQMELTRDLGNAEQSWLLVNQLLQLQPSIPDRYILAARVAEDIGRLDAAREWVAQGLELFTQDADLCSEAGRFYLRSGERARAVKLLKRSLELRPHQPELRARLSYLDRKHAPYEESYRGDPVALAQSSLSKRGKKLPDAEYLLSQRVSRLFSDGTTSTWTQHVLRINKVPASGQWTWSMPFDSSRQTVSVEVARRVRSDGSVVNDADIGEVQMSEAWYGLYYDQRAAVVKFERIRPGDVLILEHRTNDFGRNLYSGLFAEQLPVQAVEPKRRVRLVWIVPSNKKISLRLMGYPNVPLTQKDDGGLNTMEWQLQDVPGLRLERRMPGYSEVGVYVHASTLFDWSAVGDWYRSLVGDQAMTTAAVMQKAKEVSQGARTKRDKVKAVHRFVAREIRYVGLEFGEHGYKPYKAEQVLARRFGDCKDKSVLMQSMLNALGIKSNLVLVRTRPNGIVRKEATSPAVFDHAILNVPELDLFLDATAPYHGIDELPWQDQGASALIVSDNSSQFVTLPSSESSANRIERRVQVEVRKSEPTRYSERLLAYGLMAPSFRERFAVPATREQRMKQRLNYERPGAKLLGSKFGADGVTSIEFSAQLPSEPTGRVQLIPANYSLLRALGSEETRNHDLVLDYKFQERWHFHVTGVSFSEPLKPQRVQSTFGEVTVQPVTADSGIAFEVHLRIDRSRISVKQYPLFRRFLRKADQVLSTVASIGGQHEK